MEKFSYEKFVGEINGAEDKMFNELRRRNDVSNIIENYVESIIKLCKDMTEEEFAAVTTIAERTNDGRFTEICWSTFLIAFCVTHKDAKYVNTKRILDEALIQMEKEMESLK